MMMSIMLMIMVMMMVVVLIVVKEMMIMSRRGEKVLKVVMTQFYLQELKNAQEGEIWGSFL